MVDSCRWSSACLCVLWSYNKQWSNGIIISYIYISFIHTSPRHTDLRQLQGSRDKKQHEPSSFLEVEKSQRDWSMIESTCTRTFCIYNIYAVTGMGMEHLLATFFFGVRHHRDQAPNHPSPAFSEPTWVIWSGWWFQPTPLKNDGVRQLGW